MRIRELLARRSLVYCILAWAVPSYASVIVQLKVVEGEGTVYRSGTRATRGLTVLVTDETGEPVTDAAVSFRLPEDGPSGVFNSGLRTEVITTGADGKATVWGMQWNKNSGPVEIRITAVKDQARAGLISTQYLSDSVAPKAGGRGRAAGKIAQRSIDRLQFFQHRSCDRQPHNHHRTSVMKAYLTFFSLLSTAAWAQHALPPPQVGFIQDALGQVHIVNGLAGNFQVGAAVSSGIISAGYSGSFGLLKSDSVLIVVDQQGHGVASVVA